MMSRFLMLSSCDVNGIHQSPIDVGSCLFCRPRYVNNYVQVVLSISHPLCKVGDSKSLRSVGTLIVRVRICSPPTKEGE